MVPGLTENRKVLFIEEVSGMGGSTVCLSKLVAGLSGKGFQVVLALYFRDPAVEKRMFPGVRTYHLRKLFTRFINTFLAGAETLPKPLKFMRTALWGGVFLMEAVRRVAVTYWIIRANKVDFVHANNSLGINMFSILAARIAGVPCVCHSRSFGTVRSLQKSCLAYAARIVTVSEGVKAGLSAAPLMREGGMEGKLVTIYDGLTEEELSFDYPNHRAMRDEYRLSEGARAVGMVGMLTEWKGFHIFLDAARYVLEEAADVVFFVVGDTITAGEPYKELLRSRAEELGISDKVIFTGLRPDTMAVYASLDIVVHASLEPEPFGRVVIEAMAASRPVVAAGDGGPAEVIRHGETGVLYRSGDARELSRQVVRLLKDPSMCARIGGNARRHVEENFSMDRTVRDTVRVYDSVTPFQTGPMTWRY